MSGGVEVIQSKPVLGVARTEAVIQRVNALEDMANVQELLAESAGDGHCRSYSVSHAVLRLGDQSREKT